MEGWREGRVVEGGKDWWIVWGGGGDGGGDQMMGGMRENGRLTLEDIYCLY